MKIVSIIGKKNTGKTTLTTKIIKELHTRGYTVASIKHSHHIDLNLDTDGKDSMRHKQAGSCFTIGSGGNTFFNIDDTYPLDQLLSYIKIMKDPDYVVLEGYKKYPYVNISTSELNDEFKELEGPDYTIAKVNMLTLDDNEIPALVNLIEERSYGIISTLRTKACGYIDNKQLARDISQGKISNQNNDLNEVLININNETIPINNFITNVLTQTIKGLIKGGINYTQYGAQQANPIHIHIHKNKLLLTIDNKPIPLNQYAEELITKTTIGLIQTLELKGHGVDDIEKLNLHIDEPEYTNTTTLKINKNPIPLNTFTYHSLKQTIESLVTTLRIDQPYTTIEINIENTTTLLTDNTPIPLNTFTQDFIKNTIHGMISSLRREDKDQPIKNIQITI